MRIALLGVGRMGRELGAHLLAEGHALTVWNRTPEKAEPLVQQGATLAATPGEAVDGAEVVLTILFGPDTVRAVVVDAGLAVPAGSLWIDVTTVGPDDTVSFAAWAAERGVRYVHAPVFGSLAPARARRLGVLVGGTDDARAAALAIVSIWADPARLREYDTPGKAAVAKLIANLGTGVAMQVMVEALRLGHAGGLTTDEVVAAFGGTTLDVIGVLKGEMVRTGRFDDTQFSANLLAKDARLMLHLADRPMPAMTAVYELLLEAIDAGFGEYDMSVIAARDR